MRKWITALVVVLALGGCSGSPQEPETPVEIPAWVGHYASDTTEFCYESGVCTLWSASTDVFEDGTCSFKVAVSPVGEGDSALVESVSCEYSVYGHYIILAGPAVIMIGEEPPFTDQYFMDMWADDEWTQLNWYGLILYRST